MQVIQYAKLVTLQRGARSEYPDFFFLWFFSISSIIFWDSRLLQIRILLFSFQILSGLLFTVFLSVIGRCIA